jgi:hypothetical protein
MVGRLRLFLALLPGLFAAAFTASMAAAEAPPLNPGPGPDPGQRIVAIGDIHGDFNSWRIIAQAAGLIDANGHWAGGNTIFVQTGDVPDRGPDTLKIIADLQRLQKEAPKAGGSVYAVLGNHEVMNVTGDLRYVSPGEYAAFVTPNSARVRDQYYDRAKDRIEDAYRARGNPNMTGLDIRNAWYAANPLGKIEHQAAWDPNGKIGAWIVSHPAVLQLGDTIFVHGGLSSHYIDKSIQEMNKKAKSELVAKDTAPGALINDARGPLWYRGLARKPGEASAAAEDEPVTATVTGVEAELDNVLRAYSASRIVVGHTPQLAGIQIRYSDRLALIDTGISAYYGGKLSWLEIIDGKLIPHDMARPAAAPAAAAAAPAKEAK